MKEDMRDLDMDIDKAMDVPKPGESDGLDWDEPKDKGIK